MVRLAVLVAAAGIVAPGQARAQTDPVQTPPDTTTEGAAAGAGAGAGADDIIVPARKRSERLLDVPVAISALSTEQLERYATNSLIGSASRCRSW